MASTSPCVDATQDAVPSTAQQTQASDVDGALLTCGLVTVNSGPLVRGLCIAVARRKATRASWDLAWQLWSAIVYPDAGSYRCQLLNVSWTRLSC